MVKARLEDSADLIFRGIGVINPIGMGEISQLSWLYDNIGSAIGVP